MTRLYIPKHATEECSTCRNTHLLPVETDEDGPYVDLEREVCNDDHCTSKLCSLCPQFTCTVCELKYCLEHRADFYHPIPDWDPDKEPEPLCLTCWEEGQKQDREELELSRKETA